ncbi:MAG TPA: group III truncated hemoglobin [Devosia sp.]
MPPTHAQLRTLIDAFYERVRADERLGPIFAAHVSDWEAHSERLTDFWSSLMLGSGRYKGNPFAMHQPFAGDLDVALFERWLELWALTTAEQFPEDLAAEFQRKARRVAESLKAGLLFDPAAPPSAPRSVSA